MKKVVVIGGAAGSIGPLCTILGALPADFAAPILAVVHVAEKPHHLPDLLQRCCAFTVTCPKKPTVLRERKVYVAAANRHLVLDSGCANAVMGPRENRHRPSVDTLFRSAARAYRKAVIAVVLSGALDDGSAGALAVKSRGGTVLVQDPDEAEVSGMPGNVMRQVRGARQLSSKDIPGVLARMVSEATGPELPGASQKQCQAATHRKSAFKENGPLAFSCPECGGALLQTRDDKTMQWRCHVGHRYTLDSFSEAHADAVERAVWVALRKLRERQVINEQLGKYRSMSPEMRRRFKENEAAAASDIHLLEEVLTRL